HRSTTVLAFRNYAFKGFVFDRMIFDFDREMFLALLPGQTFRKRPRFEHTLHLQTEVVMQSARVVFPNCKSTGAAHLFWQWFPAARLGRLRTIPLRLVLLQAHPPNLTPKAFVYETDIGALTAAPGRRCTA